MASNTLLVLFPLLAVALAEVAIVCEHGTKSIQCPDDKILYITKADYGRVGNKICPRHYTPNAPQLNQKTPCRYDVTSILKEWCQGKSDCSFQVNNGRMRDDPCVGTYKFLTLDYACKTQKPKPEITERRICEGKSTSIKCRGKRVLKIVKATYGRTSRQGCQRGLNGEYNRRSPQVNPTSPCTKNVKSIVGSMCNGKKSCVVQSSNDAYKKDPCEEDIYKMTQVAFKCIKDPSLKAKMMTKNICEHDKAEVMCPAGFKINIKGAVYGRADSGICMKHYSAGSHALAKTNCARNVAAKIKSTCQGREACVVEATNGAYGDPCWGTYKYLALNYKCQSSVPVYKAEPIFKDICEGRGGAISCPAGQKISVLKAVYGRTDKAVCTLNMPPHHGALQKTDCRRDVKAKVMGHCEGKQSCNVAANNQLYGDPCWGTYKYLEILHLCN